MAERFGLFDQLRVALGQDLALLPTLAEWLHAGEALIERGAQTPDVGRDRDGLDAALLGGHVRRGAHLAAERYGSRREPRDAQIQQARRISHREVRGLDVQVGDRATVHVRERRAHPDTKEADLRDAHLVVRGKVVLEGLRAHVLEHEIGPRLGQVLAQESHEVRVLEAPRDRRFALERRDGVTLAEPVRPEDLDRDLAEQRAIPGVEDLVPAPGILRADDDERLVDLVSALEPPALFHGGRHGKPRAASSADRRAAPGDRAARSRARR